MSSAPVRLGAGTSVPVPRTSEPEQRTIDRIRPVFLGTLVGQGLAVASMPLLTRVYQPADFVVYGLVMSVAAPFSVLATMRFEMAIVAARSASDARSLVAAILRFAIPFGLLGMTALVSLSFAGVLGFGAVPWTAAIVACPIVASVASIVAIRQYLVRRERFPEVGASVLTHGIVATAGQLALGLGGVGSVGLLLGVLCGRLMALVVMLRDGWRRIVVPWALVRRAMVAYAEFPRRSLPSALMGTVILYVQIPIVTDLFGPTAGGAFTVVLTGTALILTTATSSVGDAVHRRLAVLRGGEATAFLDRAVLRLTAIGLGPTLLGIWLAPILTPWVLGPEWALAGRILAAMAPLCLVQFVVIPMTRAVFVQRAFRLQFWFDVLRLVALPTVFVLSALRGGDVVTTLWAWSSVGGIGYAIHLLLIRRSVAECSP